MSERSNDGCPHTALTLGKSGWHCAACLRIFLPSGETDCEQEAVRLRHDIERHVAICAEQATQIEQLRGTLKVTHQALLEVNHAQEVGANWYTRGESGLYQQVRMWVRRGLEAMQKVGIS